MAHKKAGGKTAQKSKIRGKRLGLKVFGGQQVNVGNLIVRQQGTKYHPGVGTKIGRGFTIYAVKKGTVQFINKKGKKFINVN
jgi:large subunit ribosomal protein L27